MSNVFHILCASKCVCSFSDVFLKHLISHVDSHHIFQSTTDVFAMILIATHESLSRQKYRYQYISLVTFLTIFTSISAVGSFAFLLVIRPEPYWNPQYVIPICGMLVSDEEYGMKRIECKYL